MAYVGLAYCSGIMDTPFCIRKTIQFTISTLLFIGILITLVYRSYKERELNFFVWVSLEMLVCLAFNMVHDITYHFQEFFYLQTFFYNVYFLTIIYQVAMKLTKQANLPNKYRITWTCMFVAFLLLNIAINIAYVVESQNKFCQELGLLVMDSLSLIFSIFFLVLGYNYYRNQKQRIIRTLGKAAIKDGLVKNPLPYMWGWIGINIFSQIVNFTQTVYYMASRIRCQFSDNSALNETIKLIFTILGFQLGLAGTWLFFLSKYSNITYAGRNSVRKDSMEENGVELVPAHKQQFLMI